MVLSSSVLFTPSRATTAMGRQSRGGRRLRSPTPSSTDPTASSHSEASVGRSSSDLSTPGRATTAMGRQRRGGRRLHSPTPSSTDPTASSQERTSSFSKTSVSAPPSYISSLDTPTGSYVAVAPLPVFRGDPGECPDAHLARFDRICRANKATSTADAARIFPASLHGNGVSRCAFCGAEGHEDTGCEIRRRMERQRREDEMKNRPSKKGQEAEQSMTNRASSPQTKSEQAGGKSTKEKSSQQDKDTKEGPNLQVAGPAGEITAGYLLKKSAKTNGWSRRWFVLNEKSGKLGYTKKQEERHFRGVITLEECNLEEVEEEEPSKSLKDSKKANGPEKDPSLVFKMTNRVAYKTVLKARSAVVLKAESIADKVEWVNKIKAVIQSKGGSFKAPDTEGGPMKQSQPEGSVKDTMVRRPADPEEELRWMSQEVRGYVEAVLNSLAANVPKAIVLCQVEKAKDMLNQLYISIREGFATQLTCESGSPTSVLSGDKFIAPSVLSQERTAIGLTSSVLSTPGRATTAMGRSSSDLSTPGRATPVRHQRRGGHLRRRLRFPTPSSTDPTASSQEHTPSCSEASVCQAIKQTAMGHSSSDLSTPGRATTAKGGSSSNLSTPGRATPVRRQRRGGRFRSPTPSSTDPTASSQERTSSFSRTSVSAPPSYISSLDTPTGSYVAVAPLPVFRGDPEECPDAHLARFDRICRANNATSTADAARIFPASLDGDAALWYDLTYSRASSSPRPWRAVRVDFLDFFRSPDAADRAHAELKSLRQRPGEAVNRYQLRMQGILRRFPDAGAEVPDAFLKSAFVHGLRTEFQEWVASHQPELLHEAVALALSWEHAKSLREAQRAAKAAAGDSSGVSRCAFCGAEGHEETGCEIRRRMMELGLRSSSGTARRGAVMARKVGEDAEEGGGSARLGRLDSAVSARSARCQCRKHQCSKKAVPASKVAGGGETNGAASADK